MKVLLTVSYDGTEYCGWQSQNGQITIQQVIEKAISKLYGREIRILGASRTDSGVHALGQRASFTPPDNRIMPDKLFLAINSFLPGDIRIISSEQVSDSFNVISCAKRKNYVYKIRNTRVHDPIQRRFAYHIKEPLDLKLMNEAAAFFLGEHDFGAFCAAHGGAKTTRRTIYHLLFRCNGSDISMEICGNGFLYNMVRIIAGTLVDVGLGKIAPFMVKEVIDGGERKRAGRTLPANGLTLVNVEY